jgi:hypothetical protein
MRPRFHLGRFSGSALITLVGVSTFSLWPALAGEPSTQPPETVPPRNEVKAAGALSAEARHGLQPGAGKERFEEERDEYRAPANKGQTGGAKGAAKTHSGQRVPQLFPGNGGRPAEKRTTELHQPGLNKPAGLAKAGSIADETETQRRLAAAGLSGTRPPSLVAAYRGPGPAILGGPALSSARNAPVINGTAMKRKP